MEKKRGFTKWLYWFTLGLAIILVYKLLDNFTQITSWIGNLFKILMPFISGLLIAYLFYLPCKKVEKLYRNRKKNKFISKKARGLSIITVYIIAILVLIIAFNVLVPNLIKSITDFINNIGYYYNTTINNMEQLPENSFWKSEFVTNIISNIQKIDIKQYLSLEKLTQYVKSAIGIVNGVFNAFVSIIVSIYLLLERTTILNFMKKLTKAIFKNDTYELIGRYFRKSNEVFFGFVGGQVLDAIVVGILTSIAMSILGVKYAVLLGVFIGLFNLIPYFGAIIAVSIAVLITIFTGGLGKAVIMAIVVIILQQIDANIINPKIIGNSLSISPLLVIFAVSVGGAYFGVLGMFLSVPVFTVIKLLIEEWIDYRNNKSIEQKVD